MMEVVMEEGGALSGCSSTTTTTLADDDLPCAAWADWSPLVDWASLSAANDDFHGLLDSLTPTDEFHDAAAWHDASAASSGLSSTTTSTPGTPHDQDQPDTDDDLKGFRLVHLLMAAAEALSGPLEARDLARVILVRLKELAPSADACGGATNMDRLAVHFTEALQSLLDGRHREDGHGHGHHRLQQQTHPAGDVLAAFQLLQDMSPDLKFGHFTANQAILEAVAGDRRVHIIDYDIMEGIQWASLMQALASRKDGPQEPHLRITAVSRGGSAGKRSISSVQETGLRLAAFAASIGQPFSFSQCRLDSEEKFRPTAIKLVKGEALVVNCMVHLPHSPHRSPASVVSFLAGAATLEPRLVTLVEEEEDAEKHSGFVGKFMEALHRYSAVCDSLEAGFPMQGRARGLVEKVFLGPRIAGAVGRAYRGGEGEGGWADWMAAAGFRPAGISFFNLCQARLLLGLFHDGYRVEEAAMNKLVLAWKSWRLLSASVWAAPPTAGRQSANGGDNAEEEDFFFESSLSI